MTDATTLELIKVLGTLCQVLAARDLAAPEVIQPLRDLEPEFLEVAYAINLA